MGLRKYCVACNEPAETGAFYCDRCGCTSFRNDPPLAAAPPAPPPPVAPPIAATTREPGFGIRFPFGDFAVNGSLRVGREPSFSPVAGQLAAYDRVSRLPAEFSVAGEELMVACLSSATNGVTINGAPIAVGVPTPVRPGDRIGLSTQLECTVVPGGR